MLKEFQKDKDGNPLAWPDPNQPDWYVDAWNGIYDSKREALDEAFYWVAQEEERVLSFGEGIIIEEEYLRRTNGSY